jgi:GT2 family glycosyltransferase
MAEPAALAPRARAVPLRPHRTATTTPRLSVVIVNYRQWENTAALVRQLRAARAARSGAAEVVVVDNHSPPHPLLRKLRRLRGVSLRRWGRNRGFARAANEGCRLSRGNWFLLLNPDVSVAPGFLDEAVALADELAASDPRAGVIGLRLRDSDGGLQPSSGPFPTLAGTLAGLALPRARRRCRAVRGRRRRAVAWVTGCGLLVRRDCFEDLGGLDERFFLYYEDVDFCRRARARGWTVWHEPRLQATHHQPLHRRQVSPLLRVVTRHALLTYAALHWPRWQVRVLAAVVGAEAWVRSLWAGWRGDAEARRLFSQLRRLARELGRGQRRRARRRLDRLVRRHEAAAP